MTELSDDAIIAGVREVVESYQTLKRMGLKKQNPGFVIKHLAKLFENETVAIGQDSQTIGYFRKVYKVYKCLSLWDPEGAPDILVENLVEILERDSPSIIQSPLAQTEDQVNNNLESGGEQQEEEEESQEQNDNMNLDVNEGVNSQQFEVDQADDESNHINENEGQVNPLGSSVSVNESSLPYASPSSQDSRATEQLDEQTGFFHGSGEIEENEEQNLDLENLILENTTQSLEFEFQHEPTESSTPLPPSRLPEPEIPSGSGTGSRGVTCPICMICIESDDYLPAHIRSHLSTISCTYCKSSFTDSATYQNHVQQMHTSQIQSNNDNKTNIRNGISTITTTTTFSHPAVESRSETTSPDFQVPSSSSSMDESIGPPVEVGKTKHQCHICNLYLSSATSLSNHIRVHTGEKPFSCSYCGRRFRQTATLNRHISVHETSHSCRHPGCNFSFNTTEERDGHERVPHAILEPIPPANPTPTVTYILLE